jgi:hypothetical protein
MFVAQAANKAAVLGKLSGPVELSVLTRLLTNAVQAQAGIMTQRTSREHKNASDRIIRNQQDREYEEALLADSRLEAETSSQAVAETRGDQTSSDDEEDDAMGLEDVVGSLQRQLSEEELEQKCFQEQVLADQQEKAALLRQMAAVQAECAERVPEPSPSDDVKVLFILPNGSKVDRTFDSKTATVASLYDFVGSQALLDTDSTPVLRYELVTTFPKTVIERKEEDSIASLKLGRRIKLHVARIVQNIE